MPITYTKNAVCCFLNNQTWKSCIMRCYSSVQVLFCPFLAFCREDTQQTWWFPQTQCAASYPSSCFLKLLSNWGMRLFLSSCRSHCTWDRSWGLAWFTGFIPHWVVLIVLAARKSAKYHQNLHFWSRLNACLAISAWTKPITQLMRQKRWCILRATKGQRTKEIKSPLKSQLSTSFCFACSYVWSWTWNASLQVAIMCKHSFCQLFSVCVPKQEIRKATNNRLKLMQCQHYTGKEFLPSITVLSEW